MKKKVILSVALIAILLAAICTIIVVRHKVVPAGAGKGQTYSSIDEANKAADFKLTHSDRLGGYPATGFEANSSTIEVTFGNGGYIRKTLGVTDNSDKEKDYPDSAEQEINGMKVTYRGENGKVYLATWNTNNFAYTISVNEGVPAEEMTEYVLATF